MTTTPRPIRASRSRILQARQTAHHLRFAASALDDYDGRGATRGHLEAAADLLDAVSYRMYASDLTAARRKAADHVLKAFQLYSERAKKGR